MGKKSRKKQAAKQISPFKKNKPNQHLSIVQRIQSTTSQIINSYIKVVSPAATVILVILFYFGAQEMSTNSGFAPWLIAIGALMAALAILTNGYVWNQINRIAKRCQRVLIFFIVCCVFFVPALIASQNVVNHNREVLSKTPIFYGELIPGNEPTPPSPSYNMFNIMGDTTPPPDSFRVMFGDDSGIYIDGPVNNTFMLRGMPFMTISTASDGTVILNTEVIDSTNHKIVKIVDNEFQANPEYAFRPRQPDKHSLVVYDWNGVEVLNIKYINSKTIWISGRFFIPQESEYVTISSSGLIELEGLKLRNVYAIGYTGLNIGLG